MEKDKTGSHGGASLPPSGRLPPTGNLFNVKSESPPPISHGLDSSQFGVGMRSDSVQFSHDISQMPDNPPKKLGHRRAHSEILTLPDDISFDSDLGVVGGMDGPSFSDEIEDDLFSMYFDMDKLNSSSATSSFQEGEPSSAVLAQASAAATPSSENPASGAGERPRVRHQHSQSMDGSTTIKPEMLLSGSDEASAADSKKALSAAKLAELALIDPKRAKRIWANRQSAARSKERKMRYIAELERKVQTLQTEATSLSAQLTLLQRDTSGLTAENSELKLRLQSMEQQVNLQDALNDALKDEIQHLKLVTGQTLPNGGSVMNFPSFGTNQQFHPNNHAMHANLATQQFQHLQIHPQKQPQYLQQQALHRQQQLQQYQQQMEQQSYQQQQHPHLQQLHQQQISGDSKMRASAQKEDASESQPSMSLD